MFGIAATAIAGAAAAGGILVARARAHQARRLDDLRRDTDARLAAARDDGERLVRDARERAEQLRERTLSELEVLEEALAEDEQRLQRLEGAAERRQGQVTERDGEINERVQAMQRREAEMAELKRQLADLDSEIARTVERAAGTTRDAVVQRLGEELKGDARIAAQRAVRALEEGVTARAEDDARRLIDLACQRYGTALPAERLVANVPLPKSEKLRQGLLADGQAILRAITELSTVEFVLNGEDTLHLQAPDPYTREIGRLAYERLVQGGNLTEKLVKKTVDRVTADLHQIVEKAGNEAARILQIQGVHPEVLLLVGKLLYRTSYTQNQWQHAIETAHLCGIMAADLGLDIRLAHRAALLHDIGKVLWSETEAVGSHAVSGAAFAREHGEPPEVVHPIAAHHADEKPSTPLAHLVAAADALSGARPGARRETLEAYGQRVDDLQNICSTFPTIKQSYVIQGGREVRVQVDPRQVDDLGAVQLSMEIARRIEDEMVYPGQIKVTVLREVRSSAMAR